MSASLTLALSCLVRSPAEPVLLGLQVAAEKIGQLVRERANAAQLSGGGM